MTTVTTGKTRKTLFDIGADLLALDNLIDDVGGEITSPEVETAVTQWYAELQIDEGRKLDGYAGLIAQLQMEADKAKAVADEFAARAQARSNRVAWLKARLKTHLEVTGRSKVKTENGVTFAIQANGGKMPMEVTNEQDQIPDAFCKLVRQVDNDSIRTALESGQELGFARLLPRGTHLRIR